MSALAIVEAFKDLPDHRRGAGRRHTQPLCLALFTLAVTAVCRGFIAISDWLKSYHSDLVALFKPAKECLPSYSTIRRVLLDLDYKAYSACLADFFEKECFQPQEHVNRVERGHGRVERRSVSVCRLMDRFPEAKQWAALKSVIRVISYRHQLKGHYLIINEPTVRDYISSLEEPAQQFAHRIRHYWHVENKVHYVRDVTQGEDASRVRVGSLPNLFALARNLALNLQHFPSK